MTDQSALTDAPIPPIRDTTDGPVHDAALSWGGAGRASVDVLEELGFSKRESRSSEDVLTQLLLAEQPPLRAFIIRKQLIPTEPSTKASYSTTLRAFAVERGLSLAHMKSVVLQVLAGALGEGVKSSFSPMFDPSFAPGFSLNLELPAPSNLPQSNDSVQEWLEVGKAGMIHPNVFESVDYDSDIYTGFILELRLDLLDRFKTTHL